MLSFYGMSKQWLLLLLFTGTGCDLQPRPFPRSYEGEGLAGSRVTQGCPSEETCSTLSPDGLRLRSLSLQETPYITAMGGTQRFAVEFLEGAPFDSEYVVEVEQGEVDVSQGPNGELLFHSTATADPVDAIVSLREVPSGELLDRFVLPVKIVSGLVLLPFNPGGLFTPNAEHAFVGAELDLQLQVNSPDYIPDLFGLPRWEAMADEGISFRVNANNSLFSVEQSSWDQGILHVGETLGRDSLYLRTGGGRFFDFPLTIVDRIDDLETLYAGGSIGETFDLLALPSYENHHVVGAPLEFSVTGPAEFVRKDNATIEMTITGTEKVELSIRSGNLSKTFLIQEAP